MSKKIDNINKNKIKNKLVCLTAYSKPISKILDKHCDIILVGDSVATALYGMKDTKKMKIQKKINHSICYKNIVKKRENPFKLIVKKAAN